jgi:hypothetical protein
MRRASVASLLLAQDVGLAIEERGPAIGRPRNAVGVGDEAASHERLEDARAPRHRPSR